MSPDNPLALFWAWTNPHTAGGMAGNSSDEERRSDESGTRPEPEPLARVISLRREP